MTYIPANTFKLDSGTLEVGKPADITLLDLNKEKEINPEEFASKGKNTPFGGWVCNGWPVATFVDGDLRWAEEDMQ